MAFSDGCFMSGLRSNDRKTAVLSRRSGFSKRFKREVAKGVMGRFCLASNYKGAKPNVGRNDPCVCGSGKKYKKCCGRAV